MTIDDFLDKTFDSKNYHCGHYAAELYKYLTGIDKSRLADSPNLENSKGLIKLEACQSPCLVFMRDSDKVFHVGVAITNDSISHLRQEGVFVDSIQYLQKTYQLSFYK